VRGVAGPRLADLIVNRSGGALDGRGPGHEQVAGRPELLERGDPGGGGRLDRLASARTGVVDPRRLTLRPALFDPHEHRPGSSRRRGTLQPQRLAAIVGCPSDPIAAAPDNPPSPVPELPLGGRALRDPGDHGAASG
jgi:hypothetical protein